MIHKYIDYRIWGFNFMYLQCWTCLGISSTKLKSDWLSHWDLFAMPSSNPIFYTSNCFDIQILNGMFSLPFSGRTVFGFRFFKMVKTRSVFRFQKRIFEKKKKIVKKTQNNIFVVSGDFSQNLKKLKTQEMVLFEN